MIKPPLKLKFQILDELQALNKAWFFCDSSQIDNELELSVIFYLANSLKKLENTWLHHKSRSIKLKQHEAIALENMLRIALEFLPDNAYETAIIREFSLIIQQYRA